MKQFNKGDLVTSTNRFSDVFKQEAIYLGVINMDSGSNYHVVGSQSKSGNISTTYVQDDEIELIATAKHIPIPKFHKGDIVFFADNEIIILSERNEGLMYLCYNSVIKKVAWYEEVLLSKEKPEQPKIEEAFEDKDDDEDDEDPNAEHNSNLMKDSMPTIEKKDH